MTYIELILVN